MLEAQLLLVASSLAYTTILSIIPVLAVSFSIFQAFGGMEKLYSTIEPFILSNLAEGSSEEAIEAIRRFIGNIHAGALGVGGFIGLVLTTMSMLSSIEKAINKVWKTTTNRPLFNRIASYWFFVTLGPLALSVIVGAVGSADFSLISKFLPGGTGIFVITALGFAIVYKYVPNRHVHWIPAVFSGVVTAMFWNIARIGYALYTTKVVSYSKIYGSLGAIPILLLWIYIVWVIILSGAALSAALQKRFELK
jgi:membrane protein